MHHNTLCEYRVDFSGGMERELFIQINFVVRCEGSDTVPHVKQCASERRGLWEKKKKQPQNNCPVEAFCFASLLLLHDHLKNDLFVCGGSVFSQVSGGQTALKTHGSVSAPGKAILDT